MSKKFKRKVYKVLEDTSLVNVKIGRYTDEKWKAERIARAMERARKELEAKQEKED